MDQRVQPWESARPSPGPINDGHGITRVRFRITGPNGFQPEHIEYHAPYCRFEESSPDQRRMLRIGDLWRGTRQRVARDVGLCAHRAGPFSEDYR